MVRPYSVFQSMVETVGCAGKFTVNRSSRLTYSIHSCPRPTPGRHSSNAGTRANRRATPEILIRQPPEMGGCNHSGVELSSAPASALRAAEGRRGIKRADGGPHMGRRVRLVLVIALAAVAATLSHAQGPATPAGAPGGWRSPDWNKPPITAANRKPAPRRSLTGMWAPADGAGGGTQAQGIPLKPNNGKPENALPYTPYGLQLYKSHHALEGFDAVLPTEDNDPRNRCEPLGVPRSNHYNVRLTQIFQDDYKVD